MEFENVFETFLLITKKRYAGMIVGEHKMLYKGVVVSRRDSCTFLKKMYSSLIEMTMNSTPVHIILDSIRHKLLMLMREQIPIKDLTITKTLGKGYKSASTPLLIYSNRLKELGMDINPGDKLEYVFAETSAKLQGYKMCPPGFIVPHNLQIDYLYYIENHISNPIDQVLTLLGQKPLVKEFVAAVRGLRTAGVKIF